jgi:hypothetical protein
MRIVSALYNRAGMMHEVEGSYTRLGGRGGALSIFY